MSFPTSLKQLPEHKLGIMWDDGHNSSYEVRHLRLACRCANCVDEWTRKPLIDESKISASIAPRKIATVGNYALNIVWSDGHDTGIYTFDHLRSLCECQQCQPS